MHATPDIPATPTPLPELRVLYAEYVQFVARVLRRMGVREADLEDECQEVFSSLYRRRDSYDGRGSVRSFVFSFARRVAADYRKRAHIRREALSNEMADTAVEPRVDDAIDARRARSLLEELLEGLDDDRRVVFVLFELEQLPMNEVAESAGCPLQTAYSRLYSARKHVEAGVERARKTGRFP
ncbi:MAG: sigma-70 family RNA polymerase sigma factor [Myxococcales bacterium]|nr:sigma-70 family RNA polymerase sigma factor [Myxococcales bacterium]